MTLNLNLLNTPPQSKKTVKKKETLTSNMSALSELSVSNLQKKNTCFKKTQKNIIIYQKWKMTITKKSQIICFLWQKR